MDATPHQVVHLMYVNTAIMTTFLIILGGLLVTNFLLLQFSCNQDSNEQEVQDDE